MKTTDIRKLKTEEQNKKLKELRDELIQLEAQSATGTPPKNPGQIKKIKRTIARIKTIMHEKELEQITQKPKEEK